MTPDALAARLACAELELQVRGHSVGDAANATLRAMKLARTISARVGSGIREQAFADLLEFELAGADAWCSGVEQARRRGDYADGMERAARDDRYGRGMERLLGVPTGRGAAWRASSAAAVERYQRGG